MYGDSFQSDSLERKPRMTQKQRGQDGRFVSLGNKKYGGFKEGVINGPPPSTARGKRRTKVKNW